MFNEDDIITYQTYCAKIAARQSSYWEKTLKERWQYMAIVADALKQIRPTTAVELGTNTISLMKFSDTIALSAEHADPDNAQNRVHVFDVRKTPWPIADKQYDVFVALQVFEHLSPAQSAVFNEVKRTSRQAILSFPYLWQAPHDKMHHMITDDIISEWTNHHKPEWTRCVSKNEHHKRKIFAYKFD